MSLIKFDGFEGYSTPADAESKGGVISSLSRDVWSYQTGRNGGKCLRFKANNLYAGVFNLDFTSIPNTRTVILGFAVKFAYRFRGSDTANPFITLGCDTANRFIAYLDGVGNLTFGCWKWSTILSPGSVKLEVDRWYYMEIKYKNHDTTGVGQFRLDEQLLYDFSGDNRDGGDGIVDWGKLLLADEYTWSSQNSQIDDMYLADTEGTENNDFLGDIRIDVINPNGAGNYTDLTPSAGANYECIDEVGFDDSDYVEGVNAADKDSYSYPDVPTDLDDAGIIALQMRQNCKRTAPAINIKIDPFIRIGSTDYSQTVQDLSDSFTEKQGDIIIEDPSDSGDWTKAKINACEFGMEVSA